MKKLNIRELALEISVASLGSNQTFLFPQSKTDAAKRFWSLKLTLFYRRNHVIKSCSAVFLSYIILCSVLY